MAVKQIYIEGLGDISFQKHRLARSVKIRISGPNVKVTLPPWMPYKTAQLYVHSKKSWIAQHKRPPHILSHGAKIGKYQQLVITRSPSTRVTHRITNNEVRVNLPARLYPEGTDAQEKLHNIAEKALLEQSELLMPDRVERLATANNFTFSDLRFKRLKGRWGSCDNKKVLTFNTYLIQLPWECVDYVIVHELTHTEHLNHSAGFWQRVENCLPDYKQTRKQLKTYSPDIINVGGM